MSASDQEHHDGYKVAEAQTEQTCVDNSIKGTFVALAGVTVSCN